MRLTSKAGKLLTGAAWASAKRHLRQWRLRRPPFRFDATRLSRLIDREAFEFIYRKYAIPEPGDEPPKYLDFSRWMEINLRRARYLGLHLAAPMRILDLGCGVGYFLYIGKRLGHEVLGLDLAETPMFNEMVDLLAIPRVVWRIEPFVPLPAFGKKFDLITAHQICFNGHKSGQLWRSAEWDYFLEDLGRHLSPGGRVALELNREDDGSLYTDELRNYFERRGATIHTQRVTFDPLLPSAPPESKAIKDALTRHELRVKEHP